jgi:hypothetical protein
VVPGILRRMMPDTGSRGRPLKTAEHLAAGDALGEAVERYRRDHPNEAATQPTPPKRQGPLAATTPTTIPGYPLNPSRPRQDVPSCGSRAAAIEGSYKLKRRGDGAAILDPIGPPELRKRNR